LKIKLNQPGCSEDTERKIKNLKKVWVIIIFIIHIFFNKHEYLKKLSQIEDLKKRQKSGEQLEKNQLEKLTNEKELIEELQKLSTI
jgi:flagellar motility protein MotE (MotC chaperone)